MAPPPLFRPFRALGYITEDVPFAVQRRGTETYVTVSVGRAWQASTAWLHGPGAWATRMHAWRHCSAAS